VKKVLLLLVVVSCALALAGCEIVHRYPAYRGTVLESGTDKPVEGAGVLAVYKQRTYWPPEGQTRYVGFQAVLTDKSGKFEIPAKFRFSLVPLTRYYSDVEVTIYKRGYGNFPGSFPTYNPMPGMSSGAPTARGGKTDPILERDHLPGRKRVTFWFPKLETEEEIEEHDRVFSVYTSEVVNDKGFPPLGMNKHQFLPPGY